MTHNWKKTFNTPQYIQPWSKYLDILPTCRSRTVITNDWIEVPTLIDPTVGKIFVQKQCAYLEDGYNATTTEEQRQRKAESKAATILEHMLFQSIRKAGAIRGPTKF